MQSEKVDVEDNFALRYELIPEKAKFVNNITTAAKKSDRLYLATDPDREGEAISAHVLNELKRRGALKGKSVHRIVFHEVTNEAIRKAISNPGEVSENLVQAQQSRDALDWLVGFNLSPLLTRKLSTQRLSAGRVQSPALRLIVERQREIEQFNPQEYWSVTAELVNSSGSDNEIKFEAALTHLSGKKLKKLQLNNESSAKAAVNAIESAINEEYGQRKALRVVSIKQTTKRERPPPPFTTSTLVQSASRKLKLSPREIMSVAQKLYEGLDINGNLTGLITYTRTDSVTLASTAIKQIRGYVSESFGSNNLPEKTRIYKTKSKNAQEAHEAIRPTDVKLTPERVKNSLDARQYQLYKLIWQRAVASQMSDAIYDVVTASLGVQDHEFRVSGSKLKFKGWLSLYKDDDKTDESSIPNLTESEIIDVTAIKPKQHFTEPPPRYNNGSLVKQLEEYGIGRPSTWPTIISKLLDRNYVTMKNQAFIAQSLGCVVVDFLNQNFPTYVDYQFTGELEDALDDIAQGERKRLDLLNEFWREFHKQIKEKTDAPRFEIRLGTDPATERELLVRVRSGGSFLQLGRMNDNEKPVFRALPPEQDPGTVTLEQAIKEFSKPSLPRKLDEKSKDGLEIEIKSSRYGNYFTATASDGTLSHYNLDQKYDPYSVSITEIEEILSLPKLPRSLGQSGPYKDIVANRGRYGPYLTVFSKEGDKFNVKLTPQDNPATLTTERAIQIIGTAKRSPGGRQKQVIRSFPSSKIEVLDGRYGPYATDGKTNVTIPQDLNPKQIDLETCQKLISNKAAKKKTTSKTRSKKRQTV